MDIGWITEFSSLGIGAILGLVCLYWHFNSIKSSEESWQSLIKTFKDQANSKEEDFRKLYSEQCDLVDNLIKALNKNSIVLEKLSERIGRIANKN